MPEPQPLTDFLTAEELAAQKAKRGATFKKRKRKVASLRSTALTADDLLMTSDAPVLDSGDHGRRAGGRTPKPELAKGWAEVDEAASRPVARKKEEPMEVEEEQKPVDAARESEFRSSLVRENALHCCEKTCSSDGAPKVQRLVALVRSLRAV